MKTMPTGVRADCVSGAFYASLGMFDVSRHMSPVNGQAVSAVREGAHDIRVNRVGYAMEWLPNRWGGP